MISWIQNHLIRHGRWIFLTLLAVIIVAFVFTIGNTPGFAPRMDGWEPDEFYGVNLNAPMESGPLRERVFYSQLLATGRQPTSEQQIEEGLRVRIALLNLADRIGLPGPTEKELGQFLRTRAAFFDQQGNFSRDRYLRFTDDLQSDPSSSVDILFRVLEEDFRIDRVVQQLSGVGFFVPIEAVAVAQRDQTTFELQIATLSIDDFKPEINIDDATLADFFSRNAERYRVPERISASIARFPANAAAIALEDAEVEAHYHSNRERFHAAYLSANSPADSANNEEVNEEEESPTPDFETVRELVENELRQQRARRLSNERAHQFAFTLYDRNIARDAPGFQQLLAADNIQLEAIAPFSVNEVGERGLPRQLLESAFALTNNRYYTGATQLDSAFGVLIFNNRIESYIPELEAVRGQVTNDYREQERRRLFAEEGSRVRQVLLLALAEAQDIEAAVEAEGWAFESLEPFVFSEAPRELGGNALEMLPTLSQGTISPMLTNAGIGRLIYVAAKQTPDLTDIASDILDAAEMLKRYSAFAATRSVLEEMIEQGHKQR
jgi:peptidyl-prolyl cis-trans isomerase D